MGRSQALRPLFFRPAIHPLPYVFLTYLHE
jgi:hypothetical protein